MAISTLLPLPPPLDLSLVKPPPTTIYAGGPIPGSPASGASTVPSPPVSTITGGVAGPPPTPTMALNKLQQAYKEKTGQDMTPEIRDRLLRGETIGAVRPGATGAPAIAGPPRGYQTLRGRESAANVDLTRANIGQIGTQQEISRGELELARAKEARAGAEFLTQQTGFVGGGGRIFARDLGIDTTGIYGADGKVADIDRFQAAQEQAQEALSAAGIDVTPDNITVLLKGQSIQTPARMTLAGQKMIADITHDTARIQLAGREVTVGEKAQEWQKIMDRAKATGDFVDPKTGLSTDTLDKWQVQMQEGTLKGVYQGDPTFQAKMAEWNQLSQDKAVFGFDKTVDETFVINPQTGATATRKKTVHVYGTNELQLAVQKNDQNFQKQLQAGFDYVDPDTGETRHVKGEQEFITDQRVGYDEIVKGPDGRPVMVNGQPLTKHIEGTQELSARLADRTADLQEKGMKLEDAQRTAQLEWDQRKYTGFYQARTVNLKSLGIPEKLWSNLDDFMRWVSDGANAPAAARLRSALGREPTPEEVMSLARGENVALTRAKTNPANGQPIIGPDGKQVMEPIIDHIEGEAGLETSRQQLQLTLQENGIKADVARQVADQDYQDKVRNGYFTTDAMGHRIRVRGTQEDQEYLTRLTAELNGDSQAAQRQFEEEQRVGYDKMVTDPTTGTARKIHIQGTQEAAQADASRADLLTRDGWDAQAAKERAAFEREEQTRTGYYKLESYTIPSGPRRGQLGTREVWVPGTGIYTDPKTGKTSTMEEHLQEIANANQVSLETVRQNFAAAENDANRIHDEFMQQRSLILQRQGLDQAKALDQANKEWLGGVDGKGGQNALDRELQTSLEQMRLDASKNQLEAEGRMKLLEASIGAGATMLAGGLQWVGEALGLIKTGSTIEDLADLGVKRGLWKDRAEGVAALGGVGAGTAAVAGGGGAATAGTAGTGAAGAGIAGSGEAGNVASTGGIGVNGGVESAGTVSQGFWGPVQGENALTGTAAGTVLPALVVAGIVFAGTKVGAGIFGRYKDKKEYQNWWENDLPISQRADFKNKVEGSGGQNLGLSGEGAAAVVDAANVLLQARLNGASVDDVSLKSTFDQKYTGTTSGGYIENKVFDKAKKVAFLLEEGSSSDLVRANAGMRSLIDDGAWQAGFTLGSLTGAEKKKLIDTWSQMPADARTITIPPDMWKRPSANWNPSKEQLQAIYDDVGKYAAGMRVQDSKGLVKGINDLLSTDSKKGGIGAKIALLNKPNQTLTANDVLTQDEADRLTQLWVQRGGDPRVDLTWQATHLNPDDVKAAAAEWMRNNYYSHLDFGTQAFIGAPKDADGTYPHLSS